MRVIISTVGKQLFNDEVYALVCPGSEGEFTVLSKHEPTISLLKKGTLRVLKTKDAQPEIFPIERGVVEVTSEHAVVLL